jgi:hypothetical protein
MDSVRGVWKSGRISYKRKTLFFFIIYIIPLSHPTPEKILPKNAGKNLGRIWRNLPSRRRYATKWRRKNLRFGKDLGKDLGSYFTRSTYRRSSASCHPEPCGARLSPPHLTAQ